MSKTYLMPGIELTDAEKVERSARIKEEDEKRDIARKAEWEKQVEVDKTKKFVTLDMLLKTRISPQEDRVVVYPDPVETVTASGIIKPKEVVEKERPMIGTVLAVGPGKMDDTRLTNELLLAILEQQECDSDKNMQHARSLRAAVERKQIPYVPGDRVLYGRFAGTPTQDPDTKTEVLIMRPSDIFAKV